MKNSNTYRIQTFCKLSRLPEDCSKKNNNNNNNKKFVCWRNGEGDGEFQPVCAGPWVPHLIVVQNA